MRKTYVVVGILALGLLAGGAWWWTHQGASEAVQYRTAPLSRGTLQASVAASGAVNPVSQVSVGTQVSGQIRDLLVDFNSEVKAGQLLAQIDPETFEYRVRSAQADVDAVRAAVLTAQANQIAAQTQVSRAQVDLTEAQRDFDRKQSLVQKQFIAQSEADKAQARVDLARTRITSPVDGIVIKRAIERGQTVASSLQAPELFVIAKKTSLTCRWTPPLTRAM